MLRKLLICLAVLSLSSLLPISYREPYLYQAGYMVLQYMALATAWNLLAGYINYINFGVSGFFGLGAYTSAYLLTTLQQNLMVAIILGGLAVAALGFFAGVITMRVRGIYFAIFTLAAAIVILTAIVETPALGGYVGMYVILKPPAPYASWIELLIPLMSGIVLISALISYHLKYSRIGKALQAIRDDEIAAEASGIPTFKLKLMLSTLSGFLIGITAACYPVYIVYLEPYSTMSLDVTLITIASALVGGLGTWYGPIMGGAILVSVLQLVLVYANPEHMLLVLGIVLLLLITIAPTGFAAFTEKLKYRKQLKIA